MIKVKQNGTIGIIFKILQTIEILQKSTFVTQYSDGQDPTKQL